MPRCLATLVIACLCTLAPLAAQPARGPLIVVGGGGTTPPSSRGRSPWRVAGTRAWRCSPRPSELPDTGTSSAKMWLDAGAKEARPVLFADRAAARDLIGRATLIWVPGGVQNRFIKAITDTGLDDLIRERHQAGVAVGGTSAGAAVLSDAMITGEADLESVTIGTTQLANGLGLWPEVIVDQHFLKRQRGNRLISAVVVVDARLATREPAVHGRPVAATDVRLSVLRDGMTYRLN